MNVSKPWMKVIFIIVLLLIILPLVILALIKFAPPVQDQPGTADKKTDSQSTTTRERRAKRETRVVKQETEAIEPEPVWEIGAISTDPTRKTKQMTPYAPGTVPGDSGVMVQYAGSPDDMVSGPVPPPQDDLWDRGPMPPIPPENM